MKKILLLIVILFLVLFITVSYPACSSDDDDDNDNTTVDDDDSGLSLGEMIEQYCGDSEEIVQKPDGGGGEGSGIEKCADGTCHRVRAVDCPSPTEGENPKECNNICAEDEICTGEDYWGFYCAKTCLSDLECPEDSLCLCKTELSGINFCEYSDCRTDEDCGEFFCTLSYDNCGFQDGWFCHTNDDECYLDSDCGLGMGLVYCSYFQSEKKWKCNGRDDCD